MQVQQWPGAVSIFIRFLPDDIHINIHTVNEDGINSIPRVRAWYIAEALLKYLLHREWYYPVLDP